MQQDLIELRREAKAKAEEVLALNDELSRLIHQIEKSDAFQDVERFSEAEQAVFYRVQSNLIQFRENVNFNAYAARSFLETCDLLTDEQLEQAPETIAADMREAIGLSLEGSIMTLQEGPTMLEALRQMLAEVSKYRSPSTLN